MTNNALCSGSNDTTIAVYLDHGGCIEGPTETVSTVTNVTQWSNESGCPLHGLPHIGSFDLDHFYKCTPLQPATERTETTEVIEIRTLRFRWDGQDEVVEHRRVLESKVRKWVKRDEWVEGGP
jgi:hypothetical protein